MDLVNYLEFKENIAMNSAYKALSSLGRPFTVLVEGNIASGKTTFLSYLNKKYDNVCILAEPIQLWRNCNGYNLLQLLYEDPKKWCFTFQSYVQLTMLQHHTLKTHHPLKLMERSLYSARYCFVDKLRKDGILPKASASVVHEWFKWITQNMNVGVDLIVYLRTTPEVAYKRLTERNRKEEKTVTFEYLKELHEVHENWLYHKTAYHCPAPVLVLNSNLGKGEIEHEYKKVEDVLPPAFLKSLKFREKDVIST